jgi:hypothetical protein
MGKGLQIAFEFGKNRLERADHVFLSHLDTIDPSTTLNLM